MMVRFGLSMIMCLMLVQSAEAQLLRRVFGRSSTQVSSSCPGGVCPVAAAQSAQVQVPLFAPIKAVANAGRGHWSYPGTIDSHLEGTHGVATQGMTREQKLDMHDALHEGTAVSVPRAAPVQYNSYYPSRSASGGGSTGSRAFSGGSTGSLFVGQVLSDGSVVTSIGAPLSAAQNPEVSKSFAIGRRDFKRALLEAAKQAQDDGDISAQDYRKLSFALKIPGVAAKMEAAMTEQARESGVAGAGAVDWDALLAFIKEMIPIIMQLIQLFSDNLQINLDHPYVSKPIPETTYVITPSNEWYSAA